MIKRSTAYFYVFVTSIILLAHAVIPHHHHENGIFIINSDCQTDNGVHKYGNTEHNPEKHVQNCFVQQVVVVRANQIKYEHKNQDNPDNRLKFSGFKDVLSKKGLNVPFPTTFSNTQSALLSSGYLTLACTSIGLRAPPSIV